MIHSGLEILLNQQWLVENGPYLIPKNGKVGSSKTPISGEILASGSKPTVSFQV